MSSKTATRNVVTPQGMTHNQILNAISKYDPFVQDSVIHFVMAHSNPNSVTKGELRAFIDMFFENDVKELGNV
jgi:hypothetical protein